MPNPKQHQAKADFNRDFLGTIDVSLYAAWAATVAFYVAVHLVEKLRAYENEHSTDHGDRSQFVRSKCRSINRAYIHLYDTSLEARYKSVGAFTVTPSDVRDRLIDTYLVEIETYVAAETTTRTAGSSGT